jgi:negative regulator of genetic competence, sporulation and motility
MKIEKLNENKIRITFNNSDLQENNIDIHSFMSNSIENQSLFLYILDKAEREIGFITDNYKLSIDAIALSNGTFIITVTRLEKEFLSSGRVQARRKSSISKDNILIYKFTSFDDFCNFENFISISAPQLTDKLSTANSLYAYNNCFFLVLQNIDNEYASEISSVISEFATFVESSDLAVRKINEYGSLVRENVLQNNI